MNTSRGSKNYPIQIRNGAKYTPSEIERMDAPKNSLQNASPFQHGNVEYLPSLKLT